MQWKVFKFFDVSQVKLPDDESASLSEVLPLTVSLPRSNICTSKATSPPQLQGQRVSSLAAQMAPSKSSHNHSKLFGPSRRMMSELSHT